MIPHYPGAAPLSAAFWARCDLPPCHCDPNLGPPPELESAVAPPTPSALAPLFAAGIAKFTNFCANGEPHACGRIFPVAGGRVIYHPVVVNELPWSAPVTFHLPSPRFVCEAVADANFLAVSDFRGWYHQLRTPPPAERAFCFWVRLPDRWQQAAITRLAMGWRASCAAADAVTRAIAGVGPDERWDGPGPARPIVYIDDVLLPSQAEAERFRAAARAAGAEVKSVLAAGPGDSLRFIGIDLTPGEAGLRCRFRASSALADKLCHAGQRLGEALSARDARRLVGFLVAFLERSGMCLAAGRPIMDQVLPGRLGGAPPRGEAASTTSALRAILADGARWRRVVNTRRAVYGMSDASSQGWGWLWNDLPNPRWGRGSWSDRSSAHVNFLEAFAVLRAIRQAPRGVELRLFCDNKVVVAWVERGCSRIPFACRLLLRMEKELIQRGCRLLAQYVPSAQNVADGLSRGERAPSSFSFPPWQVSYPRRVLGWCAPADDAQPSPPPAAASEDELLMAERLAEDAWDGVDEWDMEEDDASGGIEPLERGGALESV